MPNGANNNEALNEKKGKRKTRKSLRRVNDSSKQLLMTSLFSPRSRQLPSSSEVEMNENDGRVENVAKSSVKEDEKNPLNDRKLMIDS